MWERIFRKKESFGNPEDLIDLILSEDEISFCLEEIELHARRIEAHHQTVKGYDRAQQEFTDRLVDPKSLEAEKAVLAAIRKKLQGYKPAAEASVRLTKGEGRKLLQEVDSRLSDLGLLEQTKEVRREIPEVKLAREGRPQETEILQALRGRLQPLVGESV